MFRRVASAHLKRLQPERLCIIKPSALGDVVQCLPLLPVLKSVYPAARISWVINRELRSLVDGHPCVDDIIPFERRGGWRGWMGLLTTLRTKRFDLVFDLQGLLRTGVMTMATRAPVRVGLQTAREGSAWTVNCLLEETAREVPAHARYWRLAEVLGCGDMTKETVVATSDEDQRWADEIISKLPRPVMAVHPGARWETKRWPVEKFAVLMRLAHEQWRGTALILGSPAERPDADRLNALIAEVAPSARVLNLAGQSTLKQLAALLSRSDFAISNDSGPMHLAAGLGTPTLGLFTCTSATRSGPGGNQHVLISTTVPCAASYCKRCPHTGPAHLACFRELEVARAWAGFQRLVDKNGLLAERSHRAA